MSRWEDMEGLLSIPGSHPNAVWHFLSKLAEFHTIVKGSPIILSAEHDVLDCMVRLLATATARYLILYISMWFPALLRAHSQASCLQMSYTLKHVALPLRVCQHVQHTYAGQNLPDGG